MVMDAVNNSKDKIWEKLDIMEPESLTIQLFKDNETYAKVYGIHQSLGSGATYPDKIVLMSPSKLGVTKEQYQSLIAHEMMHYYHRPHEGDISLLLAEGIATYAEEYEHYTRDIKYQRIKIPTFEQLYFCEDEKQVALYSYSYIEFLEQAYSWDRTLELSYTGNYEKALGKSEKQIYEEWLQYLSSSPKYTR